MRFFKKKVGLATSSATQTTFSGLVYVSDQPTDVGTQLTTLNTKTTNQTYTSNKTIFSGTINGSLDNTSTINSITTGYYDPTSSIQTQFNSATTRIGTLETKTTGLSYSRTTSTFSGTIHGSLDNTSTISGWETGPFEMFNKVTKDL
jgi:hypothetical protein